jgi:CBS domain-containing protein
MVKLVKHILDVKGSQVWSTNLETPVFDALTLMSEKGVGALPVIESGKLIGIVSERDFIRKVILVGKPPEETRVKEIMTAPVLYITPEQRIERCMALMTEKRIRHLPVLEDGEMIGIISIGDMVKAIIEQQQIWIRELEHHVLTTTSIV